MLRVVAHAVIPSDLVERLWAVWQAAPLLCTLELPVVVKKNAPVMCRGLRTLSRELQLRYFVGAGNPGVLAAQRLMPSGQDLVRCDLDMHAFLHMACKSVKRS